MIGSKSEILNIWSGGEGAVRDPFENLMKAMYPSPSEMYFHKILHIQFQEVCKVNGLQ